MAMIGLGPMELLLLFSLAGGGGNLFDHVPLNDFWKSQKIVVSADSMKAILVDAPATDVSDIIKRLDSEKYVEREKAFSELKRSGAANLPTLTKAAEAAESAEVRAQLHRAIDAIKQRTANRATLRMLALRTIGERKYKELLPDVRTLTKNDNWLLAQYAEEAAARLEGKPYKRAVPTAEMLDSDLALLPTDVGTVGQIRPPHVNTQDIFKPFKAMAGFGLPIAGGGADIEKKLKDGLVKAAVKIGNVRIDSATLGVADDVGPSSGYAVIVLRGYYSPAAFGKLLDEYGGKKVARSKIEDIDMYRIEDEVAILAPSNRRLIFIVGENAEELPIAQVAKSIKTAPAKPSFSGPITKLLAKVDRTKIGWMVSRMNDTLREAPPLEPLDWIVGEADQDAKGALTIKIWGEGSDAAAIAKVMNDGRRELKKALAEVDKIGAAMPMMAPLVKIMKSIKLENEGNKASVSLKIDDINSLLMAPMMMFGFAFDAAPPAVVEIAPEIEAVPLERAKPRRPPVRERRVEKKAGSRAAKAIESAK